MIRPRLIALIAVAIVSAGAGVTAPTAAAQQSEAGITEIATGGFGNPLNQFSWSMAWFKGKLYIGTAANELCVENATLQYYYPNLPIYGPNPAPDLHCAANADDLDLRAEIWQYTPQTNTWKRVYRSPADIPNPHDPSKMVARDIGYRGMVVYHDQLYVGGVTADEYLPQLADAHPPRILRTSDGTSWTALNGAPKTLSTYLGTQKPIGYRSMVVYHDRLFVTASSGLTGDGVILEVKGADGNSPSFTQVSPSSLQVFELQPFNDQLYVGTGNADNGYGVYRTRLDTTPATFTPIVMDGAGRGKTVTSVVSMQPFGGRLYVGASGWGNGAIFPVSELISIGTGDDWNVVVGAARAGKSPVSGLPDGFGNPFNAHFWRMEDAGGALLLGTNDWTWALRNIPILGSWLRPFMGYDLYGTCDGRNWWPATINAFGDGRYNFGARTLETTPAGTFLGSANHAQGTAVWRGPTSGICPLGARTSPALGSAASAHGSSHRSDVAAARPGRLMADVQRCGTVLSWDGVRGARGYRVVRTENRRVHDVRVPRRPRHQAAVPNAPPPLLRGRQARRATFSLPGAATTLATTDSTFFVDHGAPTDRRATYSVVSVDPTGRDALPSNLVTTPSAQPKATFARLRALIDAAAHPLGQGRASAAHAASGRLHGLASRSLARWRHGDRTGAVRDLDRLVAAERTMAHAARARDATATENLNDAALRLSRRLRYAGVSCTP